MTYGRSLQRNLAHFNLPAAFTEWAPLAQNRARWSKLVTEPPFKLGKPFVRQPRGDTRVTPEISAWRNSARPRLPSSGRTSTPPTTEEIRQYTGNTGTAPTRHTDANPFVDPGRAGGVRGMKHHHKPKLHPSASRTRTRTRTYTIPNGTKANAAGLSGRAESCGDLHNSLGAARSTTQRKNFSTNTP